MTASALSPSLLSGIPPWMWLALGLAIFLPVFKELWGAKVKGWAGEKMVSHLGLRKLDSSIYQVFDDLYLPRPDGQGTTQLDHVVVSPFGVFVIETKNYQGWIIGSEKQKDWTQSIYKKKHRFQNPLHQNDLHVRALAGLLGLDRRIFHSVVFFIGDCTFKTELPENVLNRGLRSYIERFQSPLLEQAAVTRCAEITYGMYADDKQRAASGAWRVPESSLHLAELLGGWPGAFLAQRWLRHKCSKASYQVALRPAPDTRRKNSHPSA